ncbi:MAG TPA: hypothetical protein PLH72_04715 [Vicinamibacterales bacterium]|nr:hypothetical protein [Vicinamibacterales bacterium]
MTPSDPGWRVSPTVLKNATCPYCGDGVPGRDGTKEHVIGKRFVPRSALDGSWNLILRACQRCNRRKAALEESGVSLRDATAALSPDYSPALMKMSVTMANARGERYGSRRDAVARLPDGA